MPKNLTVDELETGLRWMFREIYNERAFSRRKRHYMDIVKEHPREAARAEAVQCGRSKAIRAKHAIAW